MQSNETVHMVTDGNSNGNRKVAYMCVFGISVAITVTKWVHNPFNNDSVAIVVAICHHVNSLIRLHTTHS